MSNLFVVGTKGISPLVSDEGYAPISRRITPGIEESYAPPSQRRITTPINDHVMTKSLSMVDLSRKIVSDNSSNSNANNHKLKRSGSYIFILSLIR